MSPATKRAEEYYNNIPENARKAGVLALLAPKENEWNVIFIKRASHPLDKHSGQISFPGGGLEKVDASLEDCALRETFEEIGVAQESIKVLGPLTKLYVFASNNLVFPYVGYIEEQQDFKIQEDEVERVITVPLAYFTDETIIKSTSLSVRNLTIDDVPYYDVYGEVLWGATAMMMSELIELWKKL